MALQHRFKPDDWQKRKAKRNEIRDNPGKAKGLPAVEERVHVIEQAVGLKPSG